jgi:16S rRNA (uracil1498-N3)-methyltransferase
MLRHKAHEGVPMSHKRFYVPRDSIRDLHATLSPGQAHHLRDVMRIRAGEVVEIFDGTGRGYLGEVELQDSTVSICRLRSLPPEESLVRVVLAAALVKSSKFEWMLQKATELGVDEFIPLKTCRSEIRIAESKILPRMERWSRIVQESSKQCRRLTAPAIHMPLSFSDFLETVKGYSCPKLLFHENAEDPWKVDPGMLSNPILLCIGPEGGWEDGEIKAAAQAGCQIFSMGSRILRAETAAIAAVSIVQYHVNLLNRRNRE